MPTSIPKGRYRHFKGNEYQVIDIAKHSESGDLLVIYRCLYGEGGLWARPLDMFLETVEHEGKTIQRFELITAENEMSQT